MIHTAARSTTAPPRPHPVALLVAPPVALPALLLAAALTAISVTTASALPVTPGPPPVRTAPAPTAAGSSENALQCPEAPLDPAGPARCGGPEAVHRARLSPQVQLVPGAHRAPRAQLVHGVERGVFERGRPPEASIVWRRSRALGRPYRGRLAHGVELPAFGAHFVTVDPVTGTSPNRAWRRYGTDRLIGVLLEVAEAHAAAHPDAARLVVGDLSRPHGGRFGREYGGDGHRSHQNGLDADVFYPRRDGLERIPTRVAQVDRRLAQELVDRFVRAGAQYVFVGPRTKLHGPPKVVMTLANHDDHLHVRIRPGARR